MSPGLGPMTGAAGPSRREMLATLARWSVPTVVTITLGARVLEAKSSCPPCNQRSAGRCKACTVSQILNCQCEPCLGPPYCTVAGGAPAASRSGAPGAGSVPSQLGPTGAPLGVGPSSPTSRQDALDRYLSGAAQDRARNNALRAPLYRNPFGVRTDSANRRPAGLYDRLRPEQNDRRRRP
jgi:hypothetical protein